MHRPVRRPPLRNPCCDAASFRREGAPSLALGYVDMRKGIGRLAMLVQGVLRPDPFSGHLFAFRGRAKPNLIKIVFWAGTGFCCSPSGSSLASFYGPRAWGPARRCR